MTDFTGSAADDAFVGTLENDHVNGMGGDDRLEGGAGRDFLIGQVGSDTLIGGLDDDTLHADLGGLDVIDGGDGADSITLALGEGSIVATGSVARLTGGVGNDGVRLVIYGAPDAAIEVDLGDGDDGVGLFGFRASLVTLGDGQDHVGLYYPNEHMTADGDPMVITDFVAGDGGDRIDWNEFLDYALANYDHGNPFASGHVRLVQEGGETLVQVDFDGAGNARGYVDYFRLEGVTAADLTVFNFSGYAPDGSAPAGTTLIGTEMNDYLDGSTGDDHIEGRGHLDSIAAGPGDDVVSGGADGDMLWGQSGDDWIDGGTGDDLLEGGFGNDTLLGGDGDDDVRDDLADERGSDFLDGGVGADIMTGHGGDDVYMVDDAGDQVRDWSIGGGEDEVRTGLADYTLPENVERVTGLGEVDQALIGNAMTNFLNGGAGADRMEGGDGDDFYVVDVSADQVVELPGQGVDTVRSPFGYVLSAELENLVLSGGGSVDATGNALANDLTGNNGRNRLDGKAGADAMAGGGGHDVYAVDNVGDRVVEGGSSGVDTVESRIDYALPTHVEKLVLIGSAARLGRGNSGDNLLTGNGVSNVLSGGRGDDRIDGGGGNDRIFGGGGNDVLSGGSGADLFYFNGALGSTNVDRILDYSAPADSLRLDRSVFGGTGPDGTLAASAFHQGGTAADADDRILYDAATGSLFYDADGNGAAAAVLFATVAAGTALTHADFVIYG